MLAAKPPTSAGSWRQGFQGAWLLPALLLSVFSAGDLTAASGGIDIERPDERQFIIDLAGIIDEQPETAIREQCDELLTAKATPIIVVTIDNMAQHTSGRHSIESFARALFDQWGIGHETVNEADWNTGILLVVSQGDRKARIELGAGWGHEQDRLCRDIMDDRIVPAFKRDDYAGGIAAGVDALAAMAAGKELPTIPRPWWHYALLVGAIVLAIFTVISMIRRGSSGWAWLFWGVVFSIVGMLLYQLFTSSRGGGGGFSGGSFGGGFSGGGGATGSW